MGNFIWEEFMVLEKLVGEKFMIPCQNIHPCFGSDMAMKVFSFKQSIHFLEPEVKKGAKHTFDHESFGVLP